MLCTMVWGWLEETLFCEDSESGVRLPLISVVGDQGQNVMHNGLGVVGGNPLWTPCGPPGWAGGPPGRGVSILWGAAAPTPRYPRGPRPPRTPWDPRGSPGGPRGVPGDPWGAPGDPGGPYRHRGAVDTDSAVKLARVSVPVGFRWAKLGSQGPPSKGDGKETNGLIHF